MRNVQLIDKIVESLFHNHTKEEMIKVISNYLVMTKPEARETTLSIFTGDCEQGCIDVNMVRISFKTNEKKFLSVENIEPNWLTQTVKFKIQYEYNINRYFVNQDDADNDRNGCSYRKNENDIVKSTLQQSWADYTVSLKDWNSGEVNL